MTRAFPLLFALALAFCVWQYLKIEAQAEREWEEVCAKISAQIPMRSHR